MSVSDTAVPESLVGSIRQEEYPAPRIITAMPAAAGAAGKSAYKKKPPLVPSGPSAGTDEGRTARNGAAGEETLRAGRRFPARAVMARRFSRFWDTWPAQSPRVALSFDSGDMYAGRNGCDRLIDGW
jgi:hypothetical protein